MSHLREKQNAWRKNNPETVQATRKRYAANNPDKIKQTNRRQDVISRENLRDDYVRKRLATRLKVRVEDLPAEHIQDLIDLQRAAMMLKRVLREIGVFIR